MSVYKDAEDLITIGAYKKGTSPEIDKAMDLHKDIEGLVCQMIEEGFSFEETLQQM
ncbi:MAG TPA: EscN/YscN/HrcN family type III secretion system ATPase, partial [Clostridiales bacterium]|nr:EscN/YscN/HrcN family type III secretion system ATPase [Clostridiales bacterium]